MTICRFATIFNDNFEGHYFPGEHVHLLTKTKEAHVGLDIDTWIG